MGGANYTIPRYTVRRFNEKNNLLNAQHNDATLTEQHCDHYPTNRLTGPSRETVVKVMKHIAAAIHKRIDFHGSPYGIQIERRA